MKRRLCLFFAILLTVTIWQPIATQPVNASGPSGTVIITQVQAGAISSAEDAANQEYISIYNNGDSEVEITGWCILNKNNIQFVCFYPVADERYILPPDSYALIASAAFALHRGIIPDSTYTESNRLVASSDRLLLINISGEVINEISWENLTGGSYYQRRVNETTGKFVDTGSGTGIAKPHESRSISERTK